MTRQRGWNRSCRWRDGSFQERGGVVLDQPQCAFKSAALSGLGNSFNDLPRAPLADSLALGYYLSSFQDS